MKTLWRIIASILTAFIAITFIPISSINVHASENVIDSGTCGDLLTWILTDSGTLTVNGVGDMTSCPWSRENIKTVIITNGITSICSNAFSGCRSLSSVTIPESVNNIGDRAFLNCESLTSINIPEGVTKIGSEAFSRCVSLTSVTIPETVTRISSKMLYSCQSLKSVIIPESVCAIESEAFSACSSLSYVLIPSSVTSIYNRAFSNCSSLYHVYYTGSESDWEKISDSSKDIKYSTIHFNTTLLPRFALGDVNGDRIISSKDSNIIKRIILSSYVPDENQLIAADINKDQVINTKDIFLLKKMIITFMM